jgi:hypothetical protein
MTTSEPLWTGGDSAGPPRLLRWPTPQAQDARHSPANAQARMDQGRQMQLAHVVGLVERGQLDPPWTSSAAGFPARTSVTPASVKGSQVPAPDSGQPCGTPFAHYDPDTSSWRTSQQSLFEDLTSSPQTWPRSGMTSNGTAYQRQPSAPLTAATDGGAWPTPVRSDSGGSTGWGLRNVVNGRPAWGHDKWPTPRASDADKGGRGDLLAMVRTGKPSGRKHWPTPTSWLGRRNSHTFIPSKLRHDGASVELTDAIGQDQPETVGGQLNPTWVEWLMGFPDGWTDLER